MRLGILIKTICGTCEMIEFLESIRILELKSLKDVRYANLSVI